MLGLRLFVGFGLTGFGVLSFGGPLVSPSLYFFLSSLFFFPSIPFSLASLLKPVLLQMRMGLEVIVELGIRGLERKTPNPCGLLGQSCNEWPLYQRQHQGQSFQVECFDLHKKP